MSTSNATSQPPAAGPDVFVRVVKLLGGKKVIKREIRSMLDVHEAISARLPRLALRMVAYEAVSLRQEDIASALGISVHTLQRLADNPGEPLTKEQSGRAWKLAEILARATDALGSREQGEAWLREESIALGGRRPIELLTTTAGTELVEQLLGRIEYGVYA